MFLSYFFAKHFRVMFNMQSIIKQNKLANKQMGKPDEKEIIYNTNKYFIFKYHT